MKHTIRALFTMALLLLIGGRCFAAADHLRPNITFIVDPNPYERMLGEVFRPLYQERALTLAVLFIPSFDSERVVGLKQQNGKSQVVVSTAQHSIWDYVEMESYEAAQRGEPYGILIDESDYKKQRAQLPGSYRDIPLETASTLLDSELAERISSVWKTALFSVRQPAEPDFGLDGTIFNFSMRIQGYGTLSGYTWSPNTGTDMHSLVTLAEVMEQYAKGQKSVADLDLAVGECEKKFSDTKSAVDLKQPNGRAR